MPLKSKKLRDSARMQECTLNIAHVCNYNPETTVLCHINTDGGTMGGKTDDFSAVFGCSDCHTHLDQNKMSTEDELFYTRRALVRTWRRWMSMGINPFK
jgi:hypothetical protein